MFLNPLMLLGITAVAVPILIHLLNKRRSQRVVWAAMRFLQLSVEQNQRRMRIEDLVLLGLRCALLALVALALARPAVHSAAGAGFFGQRKVTAVVALDNSYSMGQNDGVMSRFARGRKAAEQIMDAMPAGSSVALLLMSDVVEGVIPEPTYDLNLVRKAIEKAQLSDRGTDLLPAVRQAVEILVRKVGQRKEAYFITDGQQVGWKQMAAIRQTLDEARDNAAGAVQSHVIFVGSPEEENLGVSDLRLDSGLAPVNHPLRFEVQVTNYGRIEARNVRVTIAVDGEAPCDETTIAAIAPGTGTTVALFGRFRAEGFHTVTASIPPDHLAADDTRTMALRAFSQLKVLLVDGDPGGEDRDSEVFYLKQALIPVSPAEAEAYFIKTQTVTAADLERVSFDGYDAVILADVSDFSQQTVKSLAGYLSRGGGLMIFPGPNIQAAFYNEQLFDKYGFLPARLGPAHGDAGQDAKYDRLQDRGFEHPVAAIWNDPASGNPATAHFYREIELVPAPVPKTAQAAEAGRERVLLRYADGRPAVMERTWGQGRVVLFSSTAGTKWNDLPVRPGIFVPLMYRTLGALVQRQDELLNVTVGQKFVYHPGPQSLGCDVLISRPGETAAGRESSKVELVDGRATIQVDDLSLAGAYEAAVGGEAPLTIKFAVQRDNSESDLTDLPADQKRLLAESAQVVEWVPGMSLDRTIVQERTGSELWMPIGLAALLAAIGETFLGQWFSRAK